MQALGSLLFLALFTAIPVIMFGVIAYRLVRWLIVRGGWRSTLEEGGWSGGVDKAAVSAALEGAGLPMRRARLSWLAGREGAYAAYYEPRRRGGSGQSGAAAKRVLAIRRYDDGPSGVVQPRVGGMLEKAALAAAAAFGGKPRDFEGWEWALVFATEETWLDPEMSARLRDLLHPGESLRFGTGWILLLLPEGEMPELLARLDDLQAAIVASSA